MAGCAIAPNVVAVDREVAAMDAACEEDVARDWEGIDLARRELLKAEYPRRRARAIRGRIERLTAEHPDGKKGVGSAHMRERLRRANRYQDKVASRTSAAEAMLRSSTASHDACGVVAFKADGSAKWFNGTTAGIAASTTPGATTVLKLPKFADSGQTCGLVTTGGITIEANSAKTLFDQTGLTRASPSRFGVARAADAPGWETAARESSVFCAEAESEWKLTEPTHPVSIRFFGRVRESAVDVVVVEGAQCTEKRGAVLEFGSVHADTVRSWFDPWRGLATDAELDPLADALVSLSRGGRLPTQLASCAERGKPEKDPLPGVGTLGRDSQLCSDLVEDINTRIEVTSGDRTDDKALMVMVQHAFGLECYPS